MADVPEAAALVPIADDVLARRGAFLEVLRTLGASELSEAYLGAYGEIARLYEQTKEHHEIMRLVERVWAERMHERGQTELLTGDERLVVSVDPGKRMDPVRNDALLLEKLQALRLDGEKLPAEVIAKVVAAYVPEPILKSNLTELGRLVKKYGKPIEDIRDACIEPRTGPMKLKVTVGDGPG